MVFLLDWYKGKVTSYKHPVHLLLTLHQELELADQVVWLDRACRVVKGCRLDRVAMGEMEDRGWDLKVDRKEGGMGMEMDSSKQFLPGEEDQSIMAVAK